MGLLCCKCPTYSAGRRRTPASGPRGPEKGCARARKVPPRSAAHGGNRATDRGTAARCRCLESAPKGTGVSNKDLKIDLQLSTRTLMILHSCRARSNGPFGTPEDDMELRAAPCAAAGIDEGRGSSVIGTLTGGAPPSGCALLWLSSGCAELSSPSSSSRELSSINFRCGDWC